MKNLWIIAAASILIPHLAWPQRDYILQEENGRVILIPKTRLQKEEQRRISQQKAASGGDQRALPQVESLQSPRPTISGATTRSPLPIPRTNDPEVTQSMVNTRPLTTPTASPQPPIPESQEAFPREKHNNTTDGISIEIVSPKQDEILKNNEALVFIRVTSYPISPTAFRVRAILNNESPKTLDNLQKPIIFSNLAQGGHLLRIYLIKPNGRVVDDPRAFAMRHFYVGDKDFRNQVDSLTPLLTVNDPIEGHIEIDGQGLFWFDFITRNAPIGKGAYGIRYRFNNVTSTVYNSKPIFWRGLREGRYQFTAELIDPDGNIVPGVFNRVERKFELTINQNNPGIEVSQENQLNPQSPATPTFPEDTQKEEDPDLPPAP
jgi:hypothetical protein